MYVIMVYDVKVERIGKVRAVGMRYLNWVQNSVFEGELTRAQIRELEHEIKDIIDAEEDSVLIYVLKDNTKFARTILGVDKNPLSDYL